MVSAPASIWCVFLVAVASSDQAAKPAAKGGYEQFATKGYSAFPKTVDEFAKPYEEFISQGDQGGKDKNGMDSGNIPAFAGNFEKYAGNFTKFADFTPGKQGGKMKQYTGNSTYAKQDSASAGGGYQQYYQKYVGGGKKDASSKSNAGYQQYYQQYMSGGSNKSGGQGGYQQYYQQYMGGGKKDATSKSSNGGYAQYYQQYLGGGGGSSKSGKGGYQQYYQQYMGGGKDSSSKSNSAGYQQYYQQFVGGSRNSGSGGGGARNVSGKSNTGGYQQYYQQYMGGGSSKSGTQGGYQQYYQQYMGGGSKDSSSKSNTAGYQQYYQQYLGGGSSTSGQGGYQQYYQQYMGGGGKSNIGGSHSSSGSEGSQHGGDSSQDVSRKSGVIQDGSSASDFDKYLQQEKKDAHDAASKANQQKEALLASPIEFFTTMPPMIMAEVMSCSTQKCVKEWYKNSTADVKKFVPKDFQHIALKTIEKEYKKSLVRIANKSHSANGTNAGESSLNLPIVAPDDLAEVLDALAAKLAIVPPMLLAQVSACTNKQCVEDWRDRTEAEIEKVVPKDYQHFALASTQKEYRKNLARVAQANASNSTQSTGAFLAATKSNRQPFSALLFVAIALFALVPGLFVIRLRAQRRKVVLEEDFLRYRPMVTA